MAQILGDDTWRLGFFIGVVPALLTVFIRWKLSEPEQWRQARQRGIDDATQATGVISDLFNRENLRNTMVGVSLATIGLATFWGCHIYGKNALKTKAESDLLVTAGLSNVNWESATDDERSHRAELFEKHSGDLKKWEMIGMFLTGVFGGGLGLVFFGAISNHLGRRGAFHLYHTGGLVTAIVLFQVLIPGNYSHAVLIVFLPIFGFLTLGMHAGYAVYFPELFPTRIRGTGTGFCFNAGRFGSAAVILTAGLLKWSPNQSAMILAPLFAVGIVVTLLAKETRGEELPE